MCVCVCVCVPTLSDTAQLLLLSLEFHYVGIFQCSVTVNCVVRFYRGTSTRTGILATILGKVPRDWGSIPPRGILHRVCLPPNISRVNTVVSRQ